MIQIINFIINKIIKLLIYAFDNFIMDELMIISSYNAGIKIKLFLTLAQVNKIQKKSLAGFFLFPMNKKG